MSSTEIEPTANPWDGMTVPYIEAGDPEEVTRRIIAQVLGAKSLDDVDAPWQANDMKAVNGHVFRIDGVTFTEYESERGVVPMARVSAVDKSTGEAMEWRSTATSVVAQLVAIHNLDGYGTDWRVVGAKTRSGNTAYHLERV